MSKFVLPHFLTLMMFAVFTSFKVGYYTSVIGLGDATIQGLVTNNGYSSHNGALSNFWRSVENIEISSSVTYAVSQASPMRGVTIQGDLRLFEGDGWSSGGFLADSTIHGNIYSGNFNFDICRLGRTRKLVHP